MSATIRHIALVADTPKLQSVDLLRASAALQKQVVRDVAPIWEVSGTVDPFLRLEDVPSGYWQIIVRESLPHAGVDGFHVTTQQEPFALVRFQPGWELSASHECIEMMVDPFGNKTFSGFSVRPGSRDRVVDYLAEVCDPCQDSANAYVVNDLALSDFCTPEYYGPAAVGAIRCSFMGSVRTPLEILGGGYLNFRDSGSQVWTRAERRTGGATGLTFVDLGVLPQTFRSLRAAVDYLARVAHPEQGKRPRPRRAKRSAGPNLQRVRTRSTASGESRAQRLRGFIEQLQIAP